VEGKTLAPILHGKQDRVRDTVFLAYRHVQRAVRQGEWKLIRYPQVDVTQLFNLRDDPHETHSLADDPRYADRVAEMLSLLKTEQSAWDDTQPLTVDNPQPAAVDVETYFPKDPPQK
jgi:arylsulfatase A-like enzyme